MFRFLLNVFLIALFFTPVTGPAQTDFSLRLELLPISGAPGLQSFAITEWQGHWLLMGGRKDGLHQRQPFAAFDEAGQNDRVYVLHPETGQSWSAPLTSLPAAIAEQLSSTNLEFSRKGDVLYLIGGYGYSATAAEHITHPQLLAVQVSGLIQAIQQGASDLKPYFLALNDQRMAVTGGQLAELGGAFYLVGGQRFDGRYNPMNHPTFTQTYTDAIRIFTIENTGASLSIGNYREWKNADQLHRRDYNMAAQIFPNGQPGLTAFSGVFQVAQDVPWLHPVDIDTSGYTPQPGFFQYLNHYHCAHAQLYQAGENQMHTVFFGGMAQYTLDAAGQLVQDDNVPFVRTIARVTRFADGRLEEVKLPVELPELLGAGAEFIPNPGLPAYANGVLRMDEFSGDSVLLGYIFGGIKSPQANIFFTNIPSAATPAAYRVWWRRPTSAVHEQAVANPLRLLVTPNPTSGELLINYQLEEKQAVRIRIFHASGRLLGEFDEGAPAAGPHFLKLETSGMPNGYLIVQLQAGNQQSTRKILLE